MSTRSRHPSVRARGRTLALVLAVLAVGCAAPATPASASHPHAAAHRRATATRCVRIRARKRTTRACSKRVVSKAKAHARSPANPSGLTVTAEPIPGGPGAPRAGAGPSGAPTSPSESPASGGPPASPSTPPGTSSPGAEWEPELSASTTEGVTEDPIDPKFLTAAPFGSSSFWIQPWRAYLDTWPASRLLDSLGINFNVRAPEAEATAQLLAESGFKLARIGVGWNSLSYENPSSFVDESGMLTRWRALQRRGIRPLLLLNADSTGPAPAKKIALSTTAPVPAGAQTVTLSAASAAEVVPGKSGFDDLTFGGSPDVLIVSVGPGDVAKLSRPLTSALPAGEHKGATLLYAPFASPTLSSGEPNPAFQETLSGWLAYVNTVCKEAASVFGPEGFDLEVWNELSFDSQFLNSEHYYSSSPEPSAGEEGAEGEANGEELEELENEAGAEAEGPPAQTKAQLTKEVARVLLDETVRFVRDPANGISAGVGITDGFADQTPFTSGAQAPLGLTALSKHLYAGAKEYPADYHEHAIRPLNALGARDTLAKSFTPLFIPHFQSLFPEYYLSALSTETVVRDIAPITTTIYGDPHGREVGPPGGTPPQKWMTEYNLSTHGATIVGPDQSTPIQTTLTPADKTHFHTKALLRSLVSTINKGMTREYFYAATGGELGIVNPSFFSALENHPETYPGPALGGETLTAFKNMLAQFQGPGPGQDLKQLKLTNITQDGEHAQFTGDTTTAHPNLYDREVLAVLPFQSSPTRFEIPIYVMTRNLLTLYQPNAPTTNPTRFDLPNETFQITLTNLPQTNTPPTITLYDPIQNKNTPAHLTNQTNNTTTIEIQATDYPRILTINYTNP